jgi:hypothetical protein
MRAAGGYPMQIGRKHTNALNVDPCGIEKAEKE